MPAASGSRGALKLAHEALHRLIAARKAVVEHQVLPDSLAIASTGPYPARSTPGTLHRLMPKEPIRAPLGVNVPGLTYGLFSADPTWPDLVDP